MKLPLLVVRHHLEENLGSLEKIFIERELPFTYRDVFRGEILPARLKAYSGFIILGGFMGVNDQDEYPFLKEELEWLKTVLEANRPVLGICLGSQLLAKALGAEVFEGNAGPEIGWHPVHLTESGVKDPVFQNIPEELMVMHWHQDTFALPAEAKLLASSEKYANQAFRANKNAYGFQFHFEADEKLVQYWMTADSGSLASAGLTPEKLQEENKKYLPKLEELARQLWGNLEPLFFEES